MKNKYKLSKFCFTQLPTHRINLCRYYCTFSDILDSAWFDLLLRLRNLPFLSFMRTTGLYFWLNGTIILLTYLSAKIHTNYSTLKAPFYHFIQLVCSLHLCWYYSSDLEIGLQSNSHGFRQGFGSGSACFCPARIRIRINLRIQFRIRAKR